MPKSVNQMPAATLPLNASDYFYWLQGLGLDRDRKLTYAQLLADPLFVNAITTNEQWRTFNVAPQPSKIQSFGSWTKNVIMHLSNPPYDMLTVSSALTSAVMMVFPQWVSGVSSAVTFTLSLLDGTGTTYKTVVIPCRHFAVIRYGSDNTIVGVSFVANDDATKAYKVMTCGVSFADDYYRGPQEIIVQPELTPDDGLLMTTAEILTYSENSVMKITPDWRHVVSQNSLTANIYSGGSIIGVSIPYGCSAEIAYLANKTIANIAVIPSMNYLIQTSNIKDLAVTTGKMADAAITATKMALNAVTELQILDGAVTENKHGDLSVSTPKLQNGAATPVKVALTEGMELALGTTAFDVDATFNPASFHLGYILVLRAGDDNPITFSYQFVNTTQSVTTRAYSAAMFVCVAQATQGHQWRPIGNYSV